MGLATAVLGSLHFGAWYLGRAKTWGSESRQDFEFNDSEENEGEEERADGHLWSYPQPGQECVDVQPEKPGRSKGVLHWVTLVSVPHLSGPQCSHH